MKRGGADPSAMASSPPPPPATAFKKGEKRDFRYPSEKCAARQLRLAFPDEDAETVEELAHLVSARRHTIEEAVDFLQDQERSRKAAASNSPNAVARARSGANARGLAGAARDGGREEDARGGGGRRGTSAGRSNAPPASALRPHWDGSASRPPSILVSHPTKPAPARANAPVHHFGGGTTTQQSSTGHGDLSARANALVEDGERRCHPATPSPILSPAPSPHSGTASPPSSSASAAGEAATAVLFTTTMTGDRRVRDHCRQIGTLLYLKRVQYDSVNLADDPVLQRRLREMYAASTGQHVRPPIPAFFVGEHFIGGYEALQEMEDDGVLMETLYRRGYPRPLSEAPRAQE
ncbi:uncharacterized protein Tco025E_10283 [Trypanosoma conorhini]|uniref:Uncharacterized protein n=1 Tax=Trypanosoma conorhini TaxID=83891 RepID=A0A422MNY7_9TRYP|nr:uncharacterized protein Tco025E_10283 [Trypanosoma conorhini]RNE94924.1 hypothetical protein Tco025E_10283 [Trypanosoma conorhini]